MKIQLTLFALLALVCFVRSEESADSAVIVLDNSNFDQIVNQNDIMLVEFYAPWCGHCKRLEPEYEKAAQELKGSIPIGKVNADEEQNKVLASRFGIKGFPTLKIFRKGNPTDYSGERTAQGIVSYMKKQIMPAVTALTTTEEVTKFSGEDKVVVIGFFANKESAEYTQFEKLADTLRATYIFGAVVGNADVSKEFGVVAPDVILFKKFDEGKNVLGSANFGDLATFVSKNSMPLVDEIGPENYNNYVEAKLPLAYLFVDLTVAGQKDTFLEQVKPAAKEFKGKINFVYIDSSKYGKHAEKLGLSGKVIPAIVIEEMEIGRAHV